MAFSKDTQEIIELSLEEKLYHLFLPLTREISSKAFEHKLEQADIPLDIDVYFSKHLFFAVFISFLILIFGIVLIVMSPGIISFGTLLIIFVCVFFAYIVYAIINPYMVVGAKVNSIKANLPLVILGMSSVAESGAPPASIFSTSTVKDKSQYVNKEFSKIVYYIDSLGISLLEAIDLVSNKTPSFELKKFLMDLKSNIESGGDLSDFMSKKASQAKFQYDLLLDNQNKKAEMFGDIYSAVVIAGPLFLFSGVMLLGMVGGGIAGISVSVLLTLGVFILVPVMNIIFLIVMNLFQ